MARTSGSLIDCLGSIYLEYVVLKPGSQHGRPCISRMTSLLLSTSFECERRLDLLKRALQRGIEHSQRLTTLKCRSCARKRLSSEIL